jgi:hypothetical protein
MQRGEKVMTSNLRRDFRRIVKEFRGQPLTLDDFSSITCQRHGGWGEAVREQGGETWSVYRRYGFGVETHLSQGLTVREAINALRDLQEVAGRPVDVPYNHYTKVAALLPREEGPQPYSRPPFEPGL